MFCCSTRHCVSGQSVSGQSVKDQWGKEQLPSSVTATVCFSAFNDRSARNEPGCDSMLESVLGCPFKNPSLKAFFVSLNEANKHFLCDLRDLSSRIKERDCAGWSTVSKTNDIASFLNEVDRLIVSYVCPSEHDVADSVTLAFSMSNLIVENVGLVSSLKKFGNIKAVFGIVRGKNAGNIIVLKNLVQSLAEMHPLEALWLLKCIDFIKGPLKWGKLKEGTHYIAIDDVNSTFFGIALRFLFYRIGTDTTKLRDDKCMQDIFKEFAKAVCDLPLFQKSFYQKRPYLMIDYIMRSISYSYSND